MNVWFRVGSALVLVFTLLAPAAYADDPKPSVESVPVYERALPNWAFGFRGAVNSFPIKSALGPTYQIYVDRILFSKTGPLSLGLRAGIIPFRLGDNSSVSYSSLKSWLAGAQVRYELAFSTRQLFVPVLGLEYDYFSLQSTINSSERLSAQTMGFLGGLMISLSWFDPVTAKESYASISLVRSYLTLEVRTANFSTSTFDASGAYYFLGLRLETE